MATNRTVGVAGNHLTHALALAYMVTNHTLGVDGIATIEEIDGASYTESLTLGGLAGTPSITSYLQLVPSVAQQCKGVAGTGHAKLINTGLSAPVVTLNQSFTRIFGYEVELDSTGVSDEAIRSNSGVTDSLISNCVVHTSRSGGSQDGIYLGNWAGSLTVDNTIVYGFHRSGIYGQNHSGTSAQTIYIDFCTVLECGATGSTAASGIAGRADDVGATVDIRVRCTYAGDNFVDYHTDVAGGDLGAVAWTGSHNGCSDTSLTTIGLTTGAQESLVVTATTQPSGSYAVFNSITGGTENYLLLDNSAGNLLYGNGLDLVSSKSDSRQDLSRDAAGNLRSTTSPAPDIGASEYAAVGGATIMNLVGSGGLVGPGMLAGNGGGLVG